MNISASACVMMAILALAVTSERAKAQYAYPDAAPPAVRVPRAVLERYVGEYVYPAGNTVMVRLRGDTLFREIPGQQVPYVPLSETLFRLGGVFTAEFVTDPTGDVTQVLSDGAATEYRLHRKGSVAAPTPAPTAAVRVPRAVLERYVGEYEYVPGQMSRTDLRVFIRLRGDTLFGVAGPEFTLTPVSDTRFRLGSTALVWEFVPQAGGVTLTMGSGFQQMKARLTKP